MKKSEQAALAAEIEASYSPRRLEEICGRLGHDIRSTIPVGDTEGLFPGILAATIAQRLAAGRPRRSLLASIPPRLRWASKKAFLWEECDETLAAALETETPAVAVLFLPPDDAGFRRIPPLTAGLLYESLTLKGTIRPCSPPPPIEDGEPYRTDYGYAPVPDQPDRLQLPASFRVESGGEEQIHELHQLLVEILIPPDNESPEQAAEAIRTFLSGEGASGWSRRLLPHLTERPHRRPPRRDEPGVAVALAALLDRLPVDGAWVETGELISAGLASRTIKEYLDPDYAADYIYFEAAGTYTNFLGDSGERAEQRYLESPRLYREACLRPLVAGFLGLCAALSLVEGFYSAEPQRYSPWEGCRYSRLTEWGAYVRQRRGTLPVLALPRVVHLSSHSEIATVTGDSSRAESLLGRIGYPLTPGAYRLTGESFISGCTSPAELGELIQGLTRIAQDPLPEKWIRFFASLRERLLHLPALPDPVVLSLPPNDELAALLLNTPESRKILIPAEGRRIIVERKNLGDLKKLLARYGYLAEIGDLAD